MQHRSEIMLCIVLFLSTTGLSNIEVTQFHQLQSKYVALWRPTETFLYVHSAVDCIRRCRCMNTTCLAFVYDRQQLSCTLGQCVVSQPTIRTSPVNIYLTQQPSCDLSAGFTVETNGQTLACLWWSTELNNFEEAKLDCLAKGSVLATFKTMEKFQILQRQTEVYLIGLDDTVEEGIFRWHDDDSILDTSYIRQIFKPGEPNNLNDEDCVEFDPSPYYRQLNDYNCNNQRKYVCEKICFDF